MWILNRFFYLYINGKCKCKTIQNGYDQMKVTESIHRLPQILQIQPCAEKKLYPRMGCYIADASFYFLGPLDFQFFQLLSSARQTYLPGYYYSLNHQVNLVMYCEGYQTMKSDTPWRWTENLFHFWSIGSICEKLNLFTWLKRPFSNVWSSSVFFAYTEWP